jgi:hypothetical protein
MRAAADAASQPAWPPPMTMTSNDSCRAIMADFYRGMRKPGSRKLAIVEVVSRETSALDNTASVSRETNLTKK